MKPRELVYKNNPCTAHRVNVYVKRGAYTHGYVKGWELRNLDGEVVLTPQPLTCASAYAYQKARFPTFADLKEYVDDANEHAMRMAERRHLSVN